MDMAGAAASAAAGEGRCPEQPGLVPRGPDGCPPGLAARAAAPTATAVVVRPLTAVYNHKIFAWREVGYRFLRTKPSEGVFEVAMRMDVYDVVKHHVVFGSIVVRSPV